MKIRFDIVSANPAILESSLTNGLISRAVRKKYIEVRVHNLREYADGRYKQIDDSPYGGGAGMILKAEPIFRCINKLKAERSYDEVIYFSPQGVRFNQKRANDFSLKKNLLLLCGHYKGIDERIIKRLVTLELSIGEYVLSCGDIAALAFVDSVARLVPGVLGDGESALSDTFQTETGFDCPQYTRPEKYDGLKVPDVLLSGNHAEIKKWREKKALAKYRKIKKLNK
ncbi:MAG: tRNA (guanosine(37)-N1)-methyltransferase TrmD [Bacteroidetes bacterium]|nr:tRNA (guanosine(37)-N1)-methyltransferase TrmD [Bacteroidota bacterium]